MLKNIATYLIFGKPLVLYGGLLTLLSFLLTAGFAYLKLRGRTSLPLRYHFHLARISLLFTLVHATLALSLYF